MNCSFWGTNIHVAPSNAWDVQEERHKWEDFNWDWLQAYLPNKCLVNGRSFHKSLAQGILFFSFFSSACEFRLIERMGAHGKQNPYFIIILSQFLGLSHLAGLFPDIHLTFRSIQSAFVQAMPESLLTYTHTQIVPNCFLIYDTTTLLSEINAIFMPINLPSKVWTG